ADPLAEEAGAGPGASETTAGAAAPSSASGSSVVAFASALAPAPGFTAIFGFGIGSVRTRSSRGITTSRPTRSEVQQGARSGLTGLVSFFQLSYLPVYQRAMAPSVWPRHSTWWTKVGSGVGCAATGGGGGGGGGVCAHPAHSRTRNTPQPRSFFTTAAS